MSLQTQTAPTVWLLLGHKAGDNRQLTTLADALEWPSEHRRMHYRWWELLSNRLLGVTLAGIDRGASSPLDAPWPDLVLTAGRRNEPVARWVRRQSGNRTRLVHVGRPWAPPECFDLIVVTPQYFVSGADNVLYIDLPLHLPATAMPASAIEPFRRSLGDLSGPYCSVLLGGDSGPFVFTQAKAARLAHWLNEAVAPTGGSVLATNSARTPVAAWDRFLDELDVPHASWDWHRPQGDNPYHAYLELADMLVVTGESMSMLAEATSTGKPLYVFDLADCPRGFDPVQRCVPWWRIGHSYRYKPLTHRLAMNFAPRRMRRDVTLIQNRLVDHGQACWAGGQDVPRAHQPLNEDLDNAVDRIRTLFDPGQGSRGRGR